MTAERPAVIVAGIGNADRNDDGVGVVVARRVAGAVAGVSDVGPLALPLDLLGRWEGCELVVVIDAVLGSGSPGTVGLVELGGAPAAGERTASSTHGLGIADVYRLARALGTAPARVVVVGVEGEDFGHGNELRPAVAGAVEEAFALVCSLVRSVQRV